MTPGACSLSAEANGSCESPEPPPSCTCSPTGMLWIGDEHLRCPDAQQLRADGLRALQDGDGDAFDRARAALAEHAEAVLRAAGQ